MNIHQAKTHFSRLLQRVANGEEVTIARAGVPVARLVRVELPTGRRSLGMDTGSVVMDPDFDAPLPPDILSLFLGSNPGSKSKAAKGRSKRKKHNKG